MKTKLQVEETYNVEWLNIDLNEEENGCKFCVIKDKNDCPFKCENTIGYFIKKKKLSN